MTDEIQGAGVQMMGTVGVNFVPTINAAMQCVTALEAVNTQLKSTQSIAKQLGAVFVSDMAKNMNSTKVILDQYGNSMSVVGGKTKEMADKVKMAESELAQIEKRLVSVMAASQKTGITIPGIDNQLSSIREIRDTLQQEGNLSKEQTKSVDVAREFSITQEATLRTLEKEAESIRTMQSGEQLLSDSASRRYTAEQLAQEQISKQWDEYITKQKTADEAEIKRQEEAAWREQELLTKKNSNTMSNNTAQEIAQYDQLLRKQSEAFSTLPAIEAEIAAVQAKLSKSSGISTAQLEKQAAVMRTQAAELRERLTIEDKITKEEAQQINELSKQSALLRNNATIALSDQKAQNAGNSNQSFLQHRMGWFASGAVFYGAQQAASEALDAMGNVEMGMTEISRVTEDATANFDDMRQELLQLGVDYGRSWTDVQDIALRWAQAGYNVSDTIELTRDSLLALNTAELDAQNATESMIGIMSQWGLQSTQMLDVIDKINKTADDYSVTSQDLVDGLLRCSGAAKIMNLSLEETLSLITVTKEATGRTGREVGNALNSIFAYMQRDKSIETLESLGIKMFTDESKTQFRNVLEVFQEIQSKWNSVGDVFGDSFVKAAQDTELFNEELATALDMQDDYNKAKDEYNDIEKRDIAQASAGVYRRNYFIGMIERLTNAQGVLNNMMDASGYSIKENERTMETYEMKVQQLKTAFTMLATEIGEAGALEMIKSSVDVVRGWIEAFEDLDPALKKVIIMLTETAAITGTVNLAMKTFFDVSVIKGIEKGVISLAGVTAGLGEAETGALGFGAALKLLASNPVVMAVAGLVTLIGAVKVYCDWQDTAIERMEESARRSLEVADKSQAQADEIRKLYNEYAKLEQNTSRTTEENERFKKVTEDLVKVLPSAATGFNNMGEAIVSIESASKAARAELTLLADDVKRSLSMEADSAVSQLPEVNKAIGNKKALADSIWKAYNSDNPQEEYSRLQWGTVSNEPYVGSYFPADQFDEKANEKAKEKLRKWHDEVLKELTEAEKVKSQLSEVLEKNYELNYNFPTSPHSIKSSSTKTTSTGNIGGSTESAEAAYERLNTEKEKLNHQMKVGEISTAQYIASLKNIESQMEAAGVEEEKIWKIQEEIASLSGKDAKAYSKLLAKQEKTTEEREQEIKQFYDDAYNDAMSYYQHVNSLGRASKDEQIKYLQELSQAHEWELDKQWSIEEEIFNLYKEELDKQQDAIEKAYNDRIDAIDAEADAKVKALQADIDALDTGKETDEREKAEKEHNEKLKELRKDLQYHQLRTGAEHEEAIADIKKQIEEEKQAWEEQQNDWSVEDKKESLQQQIEDVKEAAEKEKELWKEKYETIKDNWDDWSAKFAEAALSDPTWEKIGIGIGQSLANGFSSSIEEMDSLISNVSNTVANNVTGGTTGYAGGTAGYNILDPDFQYLEDTWPGGAQAYIEGQQKRYKKAKAENKYDVMAALEADAERVGYPLAHIGAFVESDGWAKLRHDERVLSPNLNFQFERLANVLQGNSSTVTGKGDVIFNAPLFNAQQVSFEDSTSMEMMGRELMRQIKKVR